MTPPQPDVAEHPQRRPPTPTPTVTGHGPVPVDRVLTALSAHGFRLITTGSHVVATRDRERVVVPVGSGELPAVVLRRLDWSLAPWLGHGQLIAETTASAPMAGGPPRIEPAPVHHAGDPPSLEVTAVVEPATDAGTWCAFVLEEPSIMGLGPSRESALTDVARATAAWLGAAPGAVLVRAVEETRERDAPTIGSR